MKALLFLALMIAMLLTTCPSDSAADCSTGLTNLTTNGTHQFGLRSDGVNLGKGQLITLDCAAQFLEIRYRMIFLADPTDGVSPLVNGDVVKVTIMKPDMTPVAEATTVVAGAPGESWLDFDFSRQGFRVVPGDYIIACTTDVPGTAYFRKGPEAVAGTLYSANDGAWVAIPNQDAMFEMSWDPDSIAVTSDDTSWSQLKVRFE